ncbi:MAG TPA: CDP-alcohol phosphatidyltransferase family protein [Chitinivibrionales bacterium]|nr:CDP-alcohol phosphatidyltransferase family protein [Chitinivibrionales bacterium]
MPLTLANRITILRIFAVPLFVAALLYYTTGVAKGAPEIVLRWVATGIFLGIFLFDAVDGYLARIRREITALGTLLDPLADKAVLVSALILLSDPAAEKAFSPHLPIWFMIAAVSRDAILVIGGLIIQSIMGSVRVQPRITGKITTFFQGTIIFWVLVGLPASPFLWLLYIAAFFTAVSAVQYLLDGIRQLEKAK